MTAVDRNESGQVRLDWLPVKSSLGCWPFGPALKCCDRAQGTVTAASSWTQAPLLRHSQTSVAKSVAGVLRFSARALGNVTLRQSRGRGITPPSSRPTPACSVSPGCGPRGIFTARAYAAYLRGRLRSNVRPHEPLPVHFNERQIPNINGL
jgi:hypothetical protein